MQHIITIFSNFRIQIAISYVHVFRFKIQPYVTGQAGCIHSIIKRAGSFRPCLMSLHFSERIQLCRGRHKNRLSFKTVTHHYSCTVQELWVQVHRNRFTVTWKSHILEFTEISIFIWTYFAITLPKTCLPQICQSWETLQIDMQMTSYDWGYSKLIQFTLKVFKELIWQQLHCLWFKYKAQILRCFMSYQGISLVIHV